MFGCCFPPRRSPTTSSIENANAMMSRNPFLIDLVIEMILEEADLHTLKTLRKLNSNWNRLDLMELGKRAVKDQLKQLDFAKKGFQEEFDRFLKDTGKIPQLFRSFCLIFPVPLNSIDFNFFIKYAPIFLHLKINGKIKTEGAIKYQKNFLSWAAPSLQELRVVSRSWTFFQGDPVIPSSEPAQFGDHLVFHKLTKIIWELDGCGDDFNFKTFLDKSEVFNPTPVLTTLKFEIDFDFMKMIGEQLTSTELSQWSQLTKLTIGSLWNFNIIVTTLLSLGQAGMRLKEMTLDMCEVEDMLWPQAGRNFSQFLETQAKSLQILNINWDFSFADKGATEDPYVNTKIKLPTFENLHTLVFYFHFNTPHPHVHQKYRVIQVPVHFPKLDHLSVNHQALQNMFTVDGEPIPLKSLAFQDDPNKLQSWKWKFPSVESLTFKGKFWNTEVPWKESLKVLEIDGVSHYPLKVSHLTNLRRIIVREWSFENKENYLAFFQHVLPLKLSSITFKSCEEPSDHVKSSYSRHFPFPVKFEQMPFYDPEDHIP